MSEVSEIKSTYEEFLELQAGVNFTTILRAAFLYESI